MTPRAWPFGPGLRPIGESRRTATLTPANGTAPPTPPLTLTTADTQGSVQAAPLAVVPPERAPSLVDAIPAARSGGRRSSAPPAPAPQASSEATPGAAEWSPSSTRPQRAALLRPDTAEPRLRDVRPLDRRSDPSRTPTGEHTPAAKGFGAEEEEITSRARRYTPKQRPAQRRGRLYERGTPANRTKDDRVDLARTMPEIRKDMRVTSPTSPGRPRALQAMQAIQASANPPDVHEQAPVLEASVVVDPALLPAAEPSAPPRTSSPPEVSTYTPLPKDAAAFERLMREHAAARGGGAAPLHWNQQETMLIPRDSLETEPVKTSHKTLRYAAIALTFLLLVGVGAFFGSRRLGSRALTTSTSAARAPTLIATEPSGAELLHAGAVLGNTPLAIPRPAEGEQLYILRMHGFVTEMVRVTPESSATIHVSLTPNGARVNP